MNLLINILISIIGGIALMFLSGFIFPVLKQKIINPWLQLIFREGVVISGKWSRQFESVGGKTVTSTFILSQYGTKISGQEKKESFYPDGKRADYAKFKIDGEIKDGIVFLRSIAKDRRRS